MQTLTAKPVSLRILTTLFRGKRPTDVVKAKVSFSDGLCDRKAFEKDVAKNVQSFAKLRLFTIAIGRTPCAAQVARGSRSNNIKEEFKTKKPMLLSYIGKVERDVRRAVRGRESVGPRGFATTLVGIEKC